MIDTVSLESLMKDNKLFAVLDAIGLICVKNSKEFPDQKSVWLSGAKLCYWVSRQAKEIGL